LHKVNLTGTEFPKIRKGILINLKAFKLLRGNGLGYDMPAVLRGGRVERFMDTCHL
jgi:hypothetical protein